MLLRLFRKPLRPSAGSAEIEAALADLEARRAAVQRLEADDDTRRADLALAVAGGDQRAGETLKALEADSGARLQELRNIDAAEKSLRASLAAALEREADAAEAAEWKVVEGLMAQREAVAERLTAACQALGSAYGDFCDLGAKIHNAIPYRRRGGDWGYAPHSTWESALRVMLELKRHGVAFDGVPPPMPFQVKDFIDAGGLPAAVRDHHGMYLKYRPAQPQPEPTPPADAAPLPSAA